MAVSSSGDVEDTAPCRRAFPRPAGARLPFGIPMRVGHSQADRREPRSVDLLRRQAERCADLLDKRMIALELRGIFPFDLSDSSVCRIWYRCDCTLDGRERDASGDQAEAKLARGERGERWFFSRNRE